MNIGSVGVFISDMSIIDWHDNFMAKMAQFYPIVEKAFGGDPGQHSYGTKLLLEHIDPMNCTVVGSRWKKDDSFCFQGMKSPLADNEPHYVILMNGKIDQIGISEAHRLESGWRIVGWDPTVNPMFYLLAASQ